MGLKKSEKENPVMNKKAVIGIAAAILLVLVICICVKFAGIKEEATDTSILSQNTQEVVDTTDMAVVYNPNGNDGNLEEEPTDTVETNEAASESADAVSNEEESSAANSDVLENTEEDVSEETENAEVVPADSKENAVTSNASEKAKKTGEVVTEDQNRTEDTSSETKDDIASSPAEDNGNTAGSESAVGGNTEQAGSTDYEMYASMSGDEQMAYIDSFASIEAFFEWYNTAKAEYESAHPEIEIGNGVIDAADIVD